MSDAVVLKRSPIIRAIVGGSYLVLLMAFLPALGAWPAARLWIGAFSAAAAFVFLYERGLEIEISGAGLRRRRSFPLAGNIFIPWDAVETVTADQKTVVRLGLLGDPVSRHDDSRLVVRGAGRAITVHVPLFRGASQDVARVLELASPAAVRWTLAEVRGKGKARLGPVAVAADGLVCRRSAVMGWARAFRLFGAGFAAEWIQGPLTVSFKDMTLVSFQNGTLRFDAGGRSLRVPLAELPNGLCLAQVISALTS
ncbi:MAG: hypothetical protein PHS14_08840 [Elusimicrobia bacterium]|nr:hypothetical protein [Elusimicrobiota bacterium]